MEPPEDTLVGLWAQVTVVRIYGSPEAARIAEAIYEWIRADISAARSPTTKADTSDWRPSSSSRYGATLVSSPHKSSNNEQTWHSCNAPPRFSGASGKPELVITHSLPE
jgi:hypothetical protein